MHNVHQQNTDIIDLRELFNVLKKRKKIIYILTSLVTLCVIIYAFFLAKPVYDVRAMIEIGKMDAGTKDETPLDNLGDVKQKLLYLYGVNSKKEREYPRVKSITIPKKSKSIFSITVEGRNNESAISHIDKVVHKLESNYAQKIKTYIDTQKKLIALTQYDITVTQKNLNDIQETLKGYNKKILNITEKDAALAGLYAIQISQNQSRLQEMQSLISRLTTRKFNLELSIAPLRITQTHVIGNVEVLDKPIKPKKALIVIVSFITSLMLSIFLAFLLEFIGGFKEENN